jgi:MYXO-CTERM domain-containing protein
MQAAGRDIAFEGGPPALMGRMLLLVLTAQAILPLPVFPECGEADRPDLCPADLEEDWTFLSYIPSAWKGTVRPQESATGASIDRAWRTTTGRTDVLISVMDTGIDWAEEGVVRKTALNTAELPFPEGQDRYDVDGNGLVNIDDYAGTVDPTAGVDVADHLLDPSDLIATFSDGIDDDGNGYVDDIAGWDFMWNDNNPYDDTDAGHGTGEALLSAEEGGDGGDVGSCPNCMLLHMRVGDGFVADASGFASAVLYATDRGADIVQVAIGSLTRPAFAQLAIDYAWDHGVVVISSAGDETAWHSNPPANQGRAVYVHGITFAGESEREASSYIAYENCTNHGARLDFSTSSESCSSYATGHTAGVAGLVISAARDAGLTLSPAEIAQLLTRNVEDIDRSDDPAPDVYPSLPGWDRFFGQGRLSAEAAVAAAAAGRIPPSIEITSPEWLAYVDPAASPTLTVAGSVQAPRTPLASWTLAAGAGLEPTSWETIASGTAPTESLGAWTLPAGDCPIPDHPPETDTVQREEAMNACTWTLLLTATDTAGNEAVARRVVYVQRDGDALPGFPVRLGDGSSLEPSPLLVDVDKDGVLDIIQATGGGWVLALNGTGETLWSAHVETIEEIDDALPGSHSGAPAYATVGVEMYAPIVATPAAGDLDGDGGLDIVVASLRGAVHVFDETGAPRPGFPVLLDPIAATDPALQVDEGILGAPVLADLDGDGGLDIISTGFDGKVYAWNSAGESLPGWPIVPRWDTAAPAREHIVSSAAVGDLDGDGLPEVVFGTNEAISDEHSPLFAYRHDGTPLPGWPVRMWGYTTDVLPIVGEGMPQSPAIADLDGDGTPEVLAHSTGGAVAVFSPAGEKLWETDTSRSTYGEGSNASDSSVLPLINSPSVGDVDGDGVLDIVTGATGIGYMLSGLEGGTRVHFDHMVAAWSGVDGTFLAGWPRVIDDLPFFLNPAVADIDGDRQMEVIAGTGGGLVHAWNADGDSPSGWPKLVGGWVIASPAVGDVDGDGNLDVVLGTRDGYLFAWTTASPAGASAAWPQLGHDPQHTKDSRTPLPGYNAGYPESGEPEPDCGCTAGTGASGWGVGVGVVVALVVGRRRRGRGVAWGNGADMGG